jgi:hypothetical protein
MSFIPTIERSIEVLSTSSSRAEPKSGAKVSNRYSSNVGSDLRKSINKKDL